MSEVIEPSDVKVIEAHIETALVKENLTEKVLAGMEKEYLPLKIKDFDDKEGYEIVKSSRLKVKALRVLAVKCTKKGRESAQAEVKAWIAKEKEIVARIEKVETYLETQEQSYEAEKEKQKAEKKRLQDAALIERSNLLLSMGAAFTGVEYALEDVVFSLELIREADESIWLDVMLPKYKAIFDRNEEVRLQKEAEEKAEKERIEQAQAELLRQQEELKQQQEKLERDRLEMERLKSEAAKAAQEKLVAERSELLEKAGVIYSLRGELYDESREVRITTDELATLPEEEWNTFLQKASDKKSELETAKQRLEARNNQLIELGMTKTPNDSYKYGENVFLPAHAIVSESDETWALHLSDTKVYIEKAKEEERLAQEKREQAIRDKALEEERERLRIEAEKETERLRLEEVKKQEEQEQMNDKQRWAAFVKDLQAVSIPQCKSSKYRKLATIAAEKLEEIKSLK